MPGPHGSESGGAPERSDGIDERHGRATAPPPQLLVVFGASGDLARRKLLPALYSLERERRLPKSFAVVGYGRTAWDDEDFRAHARRALDEFSAAPLDLNAWEQLSERLHYFSGSLERSDLASLNERLTSLERALGTEGARLYYAATPPSAFQALIDNLGRLETRLPPRIVIEKPFGFDGAGARRLNRLVHQVFDESQLFRIDHYLGKEAVQNLLVLRFANPLFERIWTGAAIDHVQITAAEQAGVAGRAAHYEETGATRDMLQNHLLQVLSFVAMEPPRSLDPDAVHNTKANYLGRVRPLGPSDVVKGQYVASDIGGRPAIAYRDEQGVDKRSPVDTFVAARARIDGRRWQGVPFYLRTGKRLRRNATEIVIWLKEPSGGLFEESELDKAVANHLHIGTRAEDGLSFAFHAKEPGTGFVPRTVKMHYSERAALGTTAPDAYERLLVDAMVGDHTLFPRQDEVERSWDVVEPILDEGPVIPYRAGTWGPPQADRLIAPRAWHLRGLGHPASRAGAAQRPDGKSSTASTSDRGAATRVA